MRLLTRGFAVWLAPPVALSYTISTSPPRAADTAAFNLQAQTLSVVKPADGADCTPSSIQVNGQPLSGRPSPEWILDEDRANVSVISSINNINHTLQLSSTSSCLPGALAGVSNSPLPLARVDGIQVTHVYIEAIDGNLSTSNSGFTVSFDRSSQQIIGYLTVPETSHGLDSERSDSSSTVTDDTDSEPNSAALDTDDESLKLQYLENELDALTAAVRKQKAVVEAARHADETATPAQSDKCLTGRIIQGARRLIKLASQRLSQNTKSPADTAVDPDCYYTHSPQSRMFAAMKEVKLCSNAAFGSQEAPPRPTPKTSSSYGGSSSSSYTSSGSGTDTLHSILAPIGVAAAFLCLSCFTVHLHRRCCNPRARAERAARREERRTQRQYARLARQHKWRTWWNQRIGRNNTGSSSDYEEKRFLIRAQEQRLEDAMQNEIRRIRVEHGDIDEEAADIQPESLPPYRSRAGSGRPPSYTSEPVQVVPGSTVVGHLVNDVTCGLEDGLARHPSPVSDITPDSSVANLSRRNSSMTLHSERSVI
ncbi:MAG: hypothetical protein Q9162_006570 [Coniocarpon cinnabarinum]